MLKIFATFTFFLAVMGGSVFGNEEPKKVPDPSFSKVLAKTIIEFGSADEVSLFDAHISYQGAEADRLREMYERWGQEEIESYFNDYFEEHFGTLETTAPLEIKDDLAKNVFHIKVKYLLHGLWNPDSEDDEVYFFNLFPVHIAEVLDFKVDPLRKTPLSLDHPTHLVEHITLVNREEEWDAVEEEKAYDTEEVAFRYEERSDGNRLRLKYEYKTKKDQIPADRLGEFTQILQEIEGLFFISINTTMNVLDSVWELLENDNFLLLGVLTICYGWIIFMLSRRKKNLGGKL